MSAPGAGSGIVPGAILVALLVSRAPRSAMAHDVAIDGIDDPVLGYTVRGIQARFGLEIVAQRRGTDFDQQQDVLALSCARGGRRGPWPDERDIGLRLGARHQARCGSRRSSRLALGREWEVGLEEAVDEAVVGVELAAHLVEKGEARAEALVHDLG